MKFSEKLRIIRRRRGFEQQELADLIGVSRVTIGNWENDKVIIRKKYIDILCKVLEINKDYFQETFENDPTKFQLPKDGYIAKAENRRLPVIGLAKAGPNLFTDPDFKDPEETASCPAGLHDPEAYWIPVIGNSMYPYLRPYSRVCVSPNMECKNGDRVVIGLADGQVMIAETHFKEENVLLKKYNDEDLTVPKKHVLFCYPIIHIREPK